MVNIHMRKRKSFDIEINEAPKNVNCTINPSNAATMTVFIIHCSNWFDQDGIKDFIFYGLYFSFLRY